MLPPLMTHTTVEPAFGATLPDSRAARPAASEVQRQASAAGSAREPRRRSPHPSPAPLRPRSSGRAGRCARRRTGGPGRRLWCRPFPDGRAPPSSRLRLIASAPSGSTPTIRTDGCWSFTAAAMPEMRPPPPTGTTTQVGAGRHHDRGLGPHGSSGVGESSRVVPGRQGHQPARPAGRVHRQELAERPAPVSIRSDERRRNANREPEWLSLPPQHSPAGSSNLRPIAGRWRTAMNDCRQLLV